ncbi:cyclic pyranopterin monophosphate synthase subunit MoaC [Desulfatibacillum alkenivorans DSM 16219]|jgi:cyclic pyranopterin phosphate synthase|uniref:Cyclic pyranopterin monophosphate synthase n=1 Tax=Desulfatibacillum alkenivorans DSM 16219 TaxID=1121393 RepID=A0A1M6SB47_9BACT|nr:cyclic pyranopterin monophosphate synthase MoaC [Desulfatibacillum alkenivorans]SHK42003.1 cyclic pyranopterin monophosphate synthase subunit MoaC [Desulfatibacillum alkenivorans DSM 16219]
MADFSHLDEKGRVQMVDVSEKKTTDRLAIAVGKVSMKPDTLASILDQAMPKGNVLETARIAGIMAAKKTWELIPMCHPLELTHVRVDFFPEKETSSIRIEGQARVAGRTGVEMEALTAVSVAALTIYDMCKSADKAMAIEQIHLVRKYGGKSGEFVNEG